MIVAKMDGWNLMNLAENVMLTTKVHFWGSIGLCTQYHISKKSWHVQNPPPSWKCLDFVSSGSSLPYLFQCSTIKHVKRVCCDAHSKHYINFQMEKICWLICSNMGRSCWEYHFQQFTIFVSKVLEWIDEEQWCYYWHCWPNWRTDSLLWKAVFWKGDWLPTSGQTLPIEPVTHHWNWKGKRRFYNCSPFCYFPK